MDSYKFIDGVYIYFVTFTLVDWLPIFTKPEPIEIINNSLRFCHDNKQLHIHAYVTMPSHIHLIVSDENYDNERLGKTLIDFRKFTGHKLADYVDEYPSEMLAQSISAHSLTDRNRQIWKPGWHAEALSTEKFLTQKVNYIHENPVRKEFVKLPEHWRHSSAGYWIHGDIPEIPITPFGQA